MDIKIEVYRDRWTNQLQMCIGDETGGYRLAGPKFNGSGKLLLSKKLDDHDIKRIREYLDQAQPEDPAGNDPLTKGGRHFSSVHGNS